MYAPASFEEQVRGGDVCRLYQNRVVCYQSSSTTAPTSFEEEKQDEYRREMDEDKID